MASKEIEVSFTLEQQDSSLLNAMISGQDNPSSPYYGQILSSGAYDQLFGPSPTQIAGLETYLSSYGMTYSRSGTLLMVHGSVGAFDAAFSTTLRSYPSYGENAWAPTTAPELPSSIASVVSSVIGLNTLIQPVTFHTLPPSIESSLGRKVSPSTPASPHASLTVVLSTPTFFLTDGGTTYFDPPTGSNTSFTATVTLPSGDTCAPCVYQWNFGDSGIIYSQSVSSTTDTYGHIYKQAINLLSTATLVLTVNVTDTQGSSGQATNEVIPTVAPSWMEQAYGEEPLFAKGYSGQGSYIGLDEECDSTFDTGTATYNTSVDTFATDMGLPKPVIDYIGPGTVCPSGDGSDGWSLETLLDMDWAHTMAPDATLEVYFGQSASGSDITGGDAQWATGTSNVFVASNSWGLAELYAIPTAGTSGPFDATWDQAAASGVTLYTATGDCGGTDNVSYLASYGPNVSYPSDIPNGVAVGGTIVQTNHTGAWLNDWVWNGTTSTTACTENNQGTGGGWSQRYTAPSYQSTLTGPGTTPPSKWPLKDPRGLPDVSMDAATYVDVYYAGDSTEGYPAGWYPTGGTSLASPMFTATSAVALQSLNRQYNTTAPGFLNPAFYRIGESASYSTSFHDVTAGQNNNPYGYSATTGWDPTSGWGTPNATGLAGGLSSALAARYPVWGEVLDATTLAPIAGALVNASAYGGKATTLSNGSYELFLVNGTYTLTATAGGYNPNTLAVTVNGVALHGENILLYPLSLGRSQLVTGVMKTQTGIPLNGGTVNATVGPTAGSASTGPSGTWTLYLLNGTYKLVGSIIIPYPWINPTFNDTTVSLVVNGPVKNVLIIMYYDLHGITGQVLNSVTGKPVPGAQVYGFDIIGATATANANGQFGLHLPTGPASFTGSGANYLNATVSAFVNENNTATVTIYLVPETPYVNQFIVTIHALAPLNQTIGVPEVAGQGSIPIVVWANNSTTGQPQVGIHLVLTSTVAGNFSNPTPILPASGMISTSYTAPYASKNVLGILNAAVSTKGWTGTNSTRIQILSDTANCGTSCYFPISGTVLASSGAVIKGATVTLMDSTGKVTKNSTTSSSTGTFTFVQLEATYTIVASKSGYQTMKPITFSVNGGEVSGLKLVLTPNQQAVGSGLGFNNVWTLVTPILLGIVLVLAAILFYRRWKAKPQAKEAEPVAQPQEPIDTSAEFIHQEVPPPPRLEQLPEGTPPPEDSSALPSEPGAPPAGEPGDAPPPPDVPPDFGEKPGGTP